MAQSPAQVRATTKYIKNNYKRIEIKFRNDDDITEKMDEHWKSYGYADRSELIKKALETQIAIDRGEMKLVKETKNRVSQGADS